MEKTVLLVDDEASLRRTVTMGLMRKGYRTESCESGVKALRTIENYKKNRASLDCAIVDIRLPDMDGLKLLKAIKSGYPDLPVIVITGYGSEETAIEAKEQEADAYLEKPFDTETLADILDELPQAGQKTERREEVPRKAAAPAETVTAYALVTLDPGANPKDAYRSLYFQENVLYCDAVKGDYDFVLLLQAESAERVEEIVSSVIKKVPGVADAAHLTVETPVYGENVVNIMGSTDGPPGNEGELYAGRTPKVRVSAYVVLEIEEEKLEAVYPVLYFNDHVVYCDHTRGKYDLVALMKGSSLGEIENIVGRKLRPLDGVLRIREWPIITLFEA